MSFLIAFEGGEACGKSTQAALLAEKLGALLTREPGGTEFGEQVRNLFQHNMAVRVDPRAEALLVASARAQHVSEVIEPALQSGRHVVTDRFVGSSLAYQGYGRGLSVEELYSISLWATEDRDADLTIFIDVSLEEANQRRGGTVDLNDRFEAEETGFHQNVIDGYRELAAQNDSWIRVDGEADVNTVFDRVVSAYESWANTYDKA